MVAIEFIHPFTSVSKRQKKNGKNGRKKEEGREGRKKGKKDERRQEGRVYTVSWYGLTSGLFFCIIKLDFANHEKICMPVCLSSPIPLTSQKL